MRDYIEECLAAEQYRLEQTENECPICCECGQHMCAVDEDMYDFNGDLVCSYCLENYLADYRMPVWKWMEEHDG